MQESYQQLFMCVSNPCLVRCLLILETCITHCYHITTSTWCGHFQNTFQARILQYMYLCYPCAEDMWQYSVVVFSWSMLTIIYIELSNLFLWNRFPAQKFNLFLVHTVILMIVGSTYSKEFFDQFSEWLFFLIHLVNCVVKPALWNHR